MDGDEPHKDCLDYSDNITEPEYHEVIERQDLVSVHIQPARSVQHDRPYADRDIPWSSALVSGEPAPTCPPREAHSKPGPAVDRNVKPGRIRIPLDDKQPAVEPREKHKQITPRSSSNSMSVDLVNQLSQLNLPKASRRNGQKETKTSRVRTPSKDVQTRESGKANHSTQRHSLDLDCHHDIDKRDYQNVKMQEGSSTRRQGCYEWPQTKEDQHDFIRKGRPQTYHEEHWYVGTCNRAEAAHALHLMNKDGTFLVRDCSKKTIAEPYVLAVYHEKRVYNIKIRFIASTSQYALGTGQRANDMFESVADIIKFHYIFPIALINGRNQASSYPENCVLTCPITKKDLDQLLR